MFRTCCFWNVGAATAPNLGQFSRNVAFAEPEIKPGSLIETKQKEAGYRHGFLQRLCHRRTKEEEILLFEKRYLKKYLRHYKLYLDHMTLPEMRLAKRCLEESTSVSSSNSSEGCSSPEASPTSRTSPKTSSKHVSFNRNLVQQARYIPVTLSGSSDDSVEEITTRQLLPADGEFDFGPFLLGGDNGPTYVSFEQPEP